MTNKQKEIVEVNDWDIKAVESYISLGIGDDSLENFEEAYQGEWPSDENFVRDLLESTGEIPKDFPNYIHIDWESTTRDIMMDYSEANGYYFRNL